MRILDTTAINFILREKVTLEGDYFVTQDIENEMMIAEFIWKRKIPNNIKNIFSRSDVSESLYLKNYFEILNKHGGRSFFNMTGLGDISILTLLKTLTESKKDKPPQLPIPEFKEKISVYVGDDGLKKRIKNEVGEQVEILPPEQI